MGFPSYIERLNAFSRYIESKTEADGWTLIQYEKTFAAFYYKEPLSKLDKWLKREQKPTIIVEAEIDDDGVIHQRVQPNQR
jgi:hypothetical protein